MRVIDTLIIGGGQAGLSAAQAMRGVGIVPVIVEKSHSPTGSWPHYYDSLRLVTPAKHNGLPDAEFPGDPDRRPLRDEVVNYLLGYAAGLDVDIRTNRAVTSVARESDVFVTSLSDGSTLASHTVVAATGCFGSPYWPQLPGIETFPGRLLHSSQYREPSVFSGCRVLVVGGGNSAIEIAAEAASTAASVTVASRAPLRFTKPEATLLWPRSGSRVRDHGGYADVLAQGEFARRPMFSGIGGDVVHWQQGQPQQFDVIVMATGYRPHLDYLSGLNVLNERGFPKHRAGMSTTENGLAFLGTDGRRGRAETSMRRVGRDARFLARRLVRLARSSVLTR